MATKNTYQKGLYLLVFLIGCSGPTTETGFADRTNGWLVVGLGQTVDGNYIVHRYEPEFGWHALNLIEPGKVSATLMWKAKGVCYVTVEARRDKMGVLTSPVLHRSESACKAIDDLLQQLGQANRLERI